MTGTGNDASLTVQIGPDGAVVVRGDIDIAGGPVLDAALHEVAATGPIVIDLSEVSFIDSSGLRCLLVASREARARGSSVVLRALGPEVARLLQITGTTEQFTIDGRRD